MSEYTLSKIHEDIIVSLLVEENDIEKPSEMLVRSVVNKSAIGTVAVIQAAREKRNRK